MWTILLVLAVTLLLLRKYLERNSKQNFWEKYGIPSIDISKLANPLELILGFKDTLFIDQHVYNAMGSAKFIGIVEHGTPVLLVKDLDLAKAVMIKDFDHFVDRRNLFKVSKQPVLQKMMPSLSGSEWRGVRVSMSPTFTTGKMRRLMDCFNNCGVELVSHLKSKQSKAVELKSCLGAFAIDVIASAVFGLNAGSIKDRNSIFLQKSKMLGETSFFRIIKMGLALYFPSIFKLLNLDTMDDSAIKFFDDILTQALRARESGEFTGRNDFLQLMVEARKGALKPERDEDLSTFEKEARLSDQDTLEKRAKEYLLDDDVVKGQGFIFFFAGYHGIAMTLCYAIHTLAYFPEIQNRLREELKGKFSEDGKIGYDEVIQLNYMEMFVSEIWRFYAITPRFPRVCGKQYENPKLGLTIPKGVAVEIPVAQIHKDPAHYPNPEKFDPEHFNAENKEKRHPYAFMPFGHGPRNCIGIRFAQVEVKTAIAHLVHNFLIEPKDSCPFPIKTVLVGHGVQIPGDVEVDLTPIQN